MENPELSVVIPAYNEEAVIAGTLEAVTQYLSSRRLDYEVVVVDDGSADRTVEVVRRQMAASRSIRLLQSTHRGKGAAVKRGMLEVRGTNALFMDADHSTPIQEWEQCAPWLRGGYEVVIGSRKMPGAQVRVHQPFLRESMGKAFTWLTNALLTGNVTDITCGFKGFAAQAARRIFALQRIDGWGFDAEILFLAKRLGYRIREIPVRWTNDERTKVRLARDAARSFAELLEIRRSAWAGRYPVGDGQPGGS